MLEIRYLPVVLEKDISKIQSASLERIKDSIERKLKLRPEIYGKPLAGIFKGYYKFKVGEYRVVYRLRSTAIIIVVIISHRKDVYQKLENRV